MPALQIIRRSSFKRTPWKNGGGFTHEVFRVPPTSEPFLWRVSVAQIESSGPFSDFTGYDRKMVLLQGRGIALKFGSGEHRVLRSIADFVEFDGAMPTHCELIDGPCLDLNLMVAKSLRSTLRLECLTEKLPVAANRGETTLIFGIQGPLSLDSDAGETARLAPWDLAILEDCRALLSKIPLGETSAPSAVIIATIRN